MNKDVNKEPAEMSQNTPDDVAEDFKDFMQDLIMEQQGGIA